MQPALYIQLKAVLGNAEVNAVWHTRLANGACVIRFHFWDVIAAAAAAIVSANAAGAELQLAWFSRSTLATKSNARYAGGPIVIGHIARNTGALHTLWQTN